MGEFLEKLIEPKHSVRDEQKIFSNRDIKNLIVPLFFEQLLVMMVGLADTFMISYAGAAAVSGVSLVNMFNAIFIYLFTALTSGGAIVISQYIGSRAQKEGNEAAGQLLMAVTAISVLTMTAMLIWDRPVLGTMFGKVEADVMEACVIYLRISAYSFPAMAIYSAGAALCRSMGKTNITMYISIISNVINVIGNAIGILVLHAGVAGVAYPSLIARVFSAAAITVICMNRKQVVFYEWKKVLRLQKDMVMRILKVAVPNGIENGFFQLIKVALSSITAMFGTAQIAANGVGQSFWSLAALLGVAMGPAFTTVIGQCVGADDRDAAEYYLRKLLRITMIASIAWNALIFAVTPFALRFTALSDEVKHLVIILVLIHNIFNAVFFPVSGAFSNGLRAAGDVTYSMFVSMFATICRLALSVVFGIWCNLGVIGIAMAMCCDWGVRVVLLLLRFQSGKWRNFRVIEKRK